MNAGSYQGLEGVSWQPLGEADPATILVLDFWPPELWKNKFLLFEATKFVIGCLRNSIQNSVMESIWQYIYQNFKHTHHLNQQFQFQEFIIQFYSHAYKIMYV